MTSALQEKQGYKKTELGWIPEEWDFDYVENIAKIITGSKDTQNKITDGLYPFYVRSQTIERINSFSFDGEAVLTSGDGVGVGKIFHYVTGKFDYHQRVYNIHNFNTRIDGRFFYEYFKQHFYKRVNRLSAKNSIDSVRMEMISKMLTPLPPLPEQQKIAEILSTVDEKIDCIDEQIEKTQELKKGLMQKLLTRGIGHTEFKDSPLGRIPACWEVVKLSDLSTKIGDIDHKMPKSAMEGIPYIMTGDFIGLNDIDFENAKKILSSDYDRLSKKIKPERNDIIIARYASVGAVRLVKTDQNFLASYSCTIIKLKQTINASYIFNYIKSHSFIRYISQEINANTQKNIGIDSLNRTPIPVPKFEEQQKIAGILSTVDDKLETLQTKKSEYGQLKKGLMQKLLTGEIRVRV